MNFKDPKRLWDVVYSMVEASQPRARNRAKINSLFNGDPPYTEQEAEENAISTNVNFLEGTEIIHKARGQFTNAFLKPGKFFTVKLDVGPVFKREEWSQIITGHFNRAMKRSPRYFQMLQDKFAGVVLHGIGPVTWFKDRDWCPKAHGIDDVFVPTGTLRDFTNLNYFAIYTSFTASELHKKALGKTPDPGWNKPLVKQALEWMAENTGKQYGSLDSDVFHHPEKLEEDFKENSGFWGSDSVPVLRCYDVYHLDDSGPGDPTWRRKIIIDQQSDQLTGKTNSDDIVIFDGKNRSYGEEVSHVIQCQYADGAVKPPFRYHSVRSLGYLLYAVCHLQNRLRCKFNDAVFESMLWYFRNVTEGDEERIQKIDLQHLGIIPEGLSWVPANERHTIDHNVLMLAMSQNRQLMSEHSSSYVQDVEKADSGREATATEIMAKVNASNAMIGSMLAEAYTYEQYSHQEICRRMCVINHKEAVRARELCMRDGVPPEIFQLWDGWEVITERVMGSGNKTLEIAQSQQLMAVKDMPEVAPDARRTIVRMFIAANTDDPVMANELVPPDGAKPSPATQMATLAWGTLIDGKPVVIAEAINFIDYAQTLLQLLDADIQRIEQAGGNPDLTRVMGLANVIQHIQQQVAVIATDKNLKPLVKQFMDALGNAANFVKAYMERIQEAMAEQGQQMDPADAAKIQAMLLAAESKARIAEDNAAQKRRHKEMQFVHDQKRKDDATKADIIRGNAKTAAEISAQKAKTDADIEAQDQQTRAGIVRDNVSAANQPKKPTKKK